MTRIALLGVALALTLPAAAGGATIRGSVVGGSEASGADWPFIAALVVRGEPAAQSQFCGGTVTDSLHIVTAAHCVEGESADRIDVVVGRTRLDESGGQRVAVDSLAVQPQYDNDTLNHDVAILTLSEPLNAPATLAPAGSGEAALGRAGQGVRVAGWGYVNESPLTTPEVLQEAPLTIMGPTRCRRGYDGFDTNLAICAGTVGGGPPGTCQGDSGGPLVGGTPGDLRLVGIVSFGSDRCADPEIPAGYTRVSSESAFISEQVGGAAPPPLDPSPPIEDLDPHVQIGQIWCKTKCFVDVGASGDGAKRVPAVLVRVRRPARIGRKGTDKTYVAKRLSNTRWRARVGLPFGVLRITARAADFAGKTIGEADRVVVEVVPE